MSSKTYTSDDIITVAVFFFIVGFLVGVIIWTNIPDLNEPFRCADYVAGGGVIEFSDKDACISYCAGVGGEFHGVAGEPNTNIGGCFESEPEPICLKHENYVSYSIIGDTEYSCQIKSGYDANYNKVIFDYFSFESFFLDYKYWVHREVKERVYDAELQITDVRGLGLCNDKFFEVYEKECIEGKHVSHIGRCLIQTFNEVKEKCVCYSDESCAENYG